MATHSTTLAWKIPWMEEPGRLQSMGSLRVGLAKSYFTFTFHFHALEKEMATHSSVLAWRIPGTGEPGGLPSMGSHRVRHDWSDLAAATIIFTQLVLTKTLPQEFYKNTSICDYVCTHIHTLFLDNLSCARHYDECDNFIPYSQFYNKMDCIGNSNDC